MLTPAGQCANQNKNHWCGQTTISMPVCHHSCLQAVSIQRKGCQKVTGCSLSFHKSKKILILLFWGDIPFTFFTFKPRVLQMQWSFLVIYAKTIFCNISLANKTTSPIQNGGYKIDLRCSHDLIDTVSEVEHCKHQYLYYTNPIPSQYQFPTRCSHGVLVNTISEMEHCITRIGTGVDFCQVYCKCWQVGVIIPISNASLYHTVVKVKV